MVNFYGRKDEYVYLDNGASTLALLDAKMAVDEFLQNYGSVHRGSGYNSEISTELYENARENILKHLDGNTEEHAVIFTSNTTDGINKFSLLSNFKKVLVSDIEHSSNKLPWLKNSKVIELKTVNYKIDSYELEKMLKKNPDIELVALSAASNITGYVTDIEEVYKICKKYNKYLFLDASQYAPHFKPSLNYCDAIVYCGHKMYAPYGIGILAGKKELFQKENKAVSGGGNVLYANIKGVIYKEVPYMHESGTPNGIGAVAISKAHDILYKEIGIDNLYEHNEKLINAISNIVPELRDAGYNVYFGEKDNNIKQTPILVISNTKKSNIETVNLLNKPVCNCEKSIFCREGAFCAYSLSEPDLYEGNQKIDLFKLHKISNFGYIANQNTKLSEKYSLIRFSAGLINDVNDIKYLKEKLIKINEV